MKKFSRKILFYYFTFTIFIFLSFQNCQKKGYLLSLPNSFNFSNSGNGSVYEGKLYAVITYKKNLITENSISLYSGESFNLEVSGGVPPYDYMLKGVGDYNHITNTYTAPFLNSVMDSSIITISDSASNSLDIEITINSFTLNSKINFPDKFSNAPLEVNPIIKSTSNKLYNVVTFRNHQLQFVSKIKVSEDLGFQWKSLMEINGKGMLILSKKYEKTLYYIQKSVENRFWISNDSGATWLNSGWRETLI